MERAARPFAGDIRPESREAAASLNDLGLALMVQQKLPEAEKFMLKRSPFGGGCWERHPDTATSLNDLRAVIGTKADQAEAMAREALRIREKWFGMEHGRGGFAPQPGYHSWRRKQVG
jgi:hypothetical protein